MYQTFSGTSRRPRQVNLSGRPSNPFAASSPAGGPQSAIASAQQDRIARQHQRDRIQASARIQRVWRGHSARRRTFQTWRTIWDNLEEGRGNADGGYASEDDSLRQLRRMLLFYQPKADVWRLTWYGMRQVATASQAATPCVGGPWPRAYLRVARACVSALRIRNQKDEELDRMLLNTLSFAARRCGDTFTAKDAIAYYEGLTALKDAPSEPLQGALLAPLMSAQAYVGLAVLLAGPLDPTMLNLLRSSVDTGALCDGLGQLPERQSARSRLWLLGNLVCLVGPAKSSSPSYIIAVARLLGSLAEDVDFDSAPIDVDNVSFDSDVLSRVGTGLLPLNTFLQTQTTSLIDQDSIRNLLVRDQTNTGTVTNDAQLLAGYALTLLRCFPRRADDIRMWLYLGPTRSTTDLGATRYFWSASKSTSVFSTIWQNSRSVIGLLKASAQSATEQRDDWTVILVFLELYTFLLKIMDDEEFMGKSDGRRSSAIPTNDVAELVTFLKNLGFTLYFNASELNGADTPASYA
ncbi:hypothetical protein B0A55_12137, partial [Friedmanniomyces simplex]